MDADATTLANFLLVIPETHLVCIKPSRTPDTPHSFCEFLQHLLTEIKHTLDSASTMIINESRAANQNEHYGEHSSITPAALPRVHLVLVQVSWCS